MKLHKEKAKVFLVDVDLTLTNEECFTIKECEKATPNKKIVNWVNKIARQNFIVIWTARRDFLIPATLEWLRRNGITYHAISNNKIPCSFMLDDKAINPKSI